MNPISQVLCVPGSMFNVFIVEPGTHEDDRELDGMTSTTELAQSVFQNLIATFTIVIATTPYGWRPTLSAMTPC